MIQVLLTNDVEEVSIVNNNLNPVIAKKVAKLGLPRILDLYSKYGVISTFYFTATFARRFPETLVEVKERGHEIGCHGYSHLPKHAFDVLSPEMQFHHLYNSKKVIEGIVGKIESFRAPALRINNYTLPILSDLGFRTDSSIASKRFDGPLTFGSLKKINWLLSPSNPYNPSRRNPYRKGSLEILELPPSSRLLGFQGTTMRILPQVNKLLASYLASFSRGTKSPIVFLFHPTEVVTEKSLNRMNRRSKSALSYFFGEVIRRRLKKINLGLAALKMHEDLILQLKEYGAEFLSLKQFREKYEN